MENQKDKKNLDKEKNKDIKDNSEVPDSSENNEESLSEQIITLIEPKEIDPQIWPNAFLEWIKKNYKKSEE